jgi:protein-L-isoaspartate(D-aspartate) O-methyltransferase
MAADHTQASQAQREAMVESQLRARGIRDGRVLRAMSEIPRHVFVPLAWRNEAYDDHPVPIAEEQTISQPFIIGLCLQLLELTGTESVLEIGTGSGYQTALLSVLSRRVYSMERHAQLAHEAEAVLTNLGLQNITIMVGDGTQGWSEHAPFNAILVSAAAPSPPRSLIEQLAPEGRMVIPVGPPHVQELQLIRKHGAEITAKTVEGCRFVPLIGADAY